MSGIFGSYRLEAEVLLIWYPTTNDAQLSAPNMRGAVFRHSTNEVTFQGGDSIIHTMGQASSPEEEELGVVAFIGFRVDDDLNFEISFEMQLGSARRNMSLRALPGQRIPFMLNLAGREGQAGTAAVLHGVITTTQPFGVNKLAATLASAIASRP
jgi:hypothetical protein